MSTKNVYESLGLNEKQIEVFQNFTQLVSANKNSIKMATLHGEDGEWTYAGYVDTGAMGNAHCSLGHALRYKHIALNTETGKSIEFGIKCICEFFDISDYELKILQQGFKETNDMAKEILKQFKDKDYNTKEIENKVNELESENINIEDIGIIKKLIAVDLPLPYKYIDEINSLIYKLNSMRNFKKFLANNNLEDEFDSSIIMANLLLQNNDFIENHIDTASILKSIISFYNNRGKLTENQIHLLSRLTSVDYNELDNKFNKLLNMDLKKNDLSIIYSLKSSYLRYGLTEKQINLLNKISDKYIG